MRQGEDQSKEGVREGGKEIGESNRREGVKEGELLREMRQV